MVQIHSGQLPLIRELLLKRSSNYETGEESALVDSTPPHKTADNLIDHLRTVLGQPIRLCRANHLLRQGLGSTGQQQILQQVIEAHTVRGLKTFKI